MPGFPDTMAEDVSVMLPFSLPLSGWGNGIAGM
jgi:hypothetical protein